MREWNCGFRKKAPLVSSPKNMPKRPSACKSYARPEGLNNRFRSRAGLRHVSKMFTSPTKTRLRTRGDLESDPGGSAKGPSFAFLTSVQAATYTSSKWPKPRIRARTSKRRRRPKKIIMSLTGSTPCRPRRLLSSPGAYRAILLSAIRRPRRSSPADFRRPDRLSGRP